MKSIIIGCYILLSNIVQSYSFAFLETRAKNTVLFSETSSSASSVSLGPLICTYDTVTIPSSSPDTPPSQKIHVEDITPTLIELLDKSKMKNGVINVISRHTTTAITINERESRLAKDMENYFLSICPPDERSISERAEKGVKYLHNDIDERPDR